MNHDELIPLVLASAAAAAGPVDNKWRQRVMENIPNIAALMSDAGREWKAAQAVLEASVFTATYVSHSVEESSTRVIVNLKTAPSKRNETGEEAVRTHRTDDVRGRMMKQRLDQLKPDDRLLVWKSLEAMASGDKVRILEHVQWIGHGDPKDEPLVRKPDVEPEVPPPGEGPEEGGPVGDVAFALEQFNDLGAKDKAAVARAAREANISFPTPTPDEVDQFLAIIGQVTGT